MRVFNQKTYREYPDDRSLDDEALVVHARERAMKCTRLYLFVHGLTGARYAYWGRTPEFLWTDHTDANIGLYFYRTAFKRIGRWRSIELDAEAEVLAGILSSSDEYRSIYIVAHSMGGLLTKGAIASLIASRNDDALGRIAGLMLFASPQAGSQRVSRLLKWLSADARALFPHNDFIRKSDASIRSYFDGRETGRYLPTWAAIAAHDFWVDPMSAGLNVPALQTRTIRGDHGAICRPPTREADSYRFLCEFLGTVQRERRRHGSDDREVVVRGATIADAPVVHSLAVDFFGEDVSSEATIAGFLRRGDGLFCLVSEVARSATTTTETMLGYYCLLPLKKTAYNQLLTGNINGAQIGPDHLASSYEAAAGLYVGAVGGKGLWARAMILERLRAHLDDVRRKKAIPLLTRPVSQDGLRTALQGGFVPVAEAGLGKLYQQTVKVTVGPPRRRKHKGAPHRDHQIEAEVET